MALNSSQRTAKKNIPRAPVNNYYKAKAKAESPFKPKEPKKSWRQKLSRLFDTGLFITIVLCLLYSLLVQPNPKTIASNSIFRSSTTYQQAAATAMTSFKDRTKLSFDGTAVVASLQKQFPEVSSGSVELPLIGQRPVVRLDIAEPSFILKNSGQNFVLASNGLLVAANSSNPTLAKLPVVEDHSGYVAHVGSAVLSSNQVSFINQVISQTKRASVQIASLTLPPAAQELDLKAKDKPYFVKFFISGDALVQTGQFLAARHQFAQNHQDPTQYLDVRVPGKIFYK